MHVKHQCLHQEWSKAYTSTGLIQTQGFIVWIEINQVGFFVLVKYFDVLDDFKGSECSKQFYHFLQ